MSEQSKFDPVQYSLEVYEKRLDSTYKAINDGLNLRSVDGDIAHIPKPDLNADNEQQARNNHDRIALFRDVLPKVSWASIPAKDPATYRWLQTSVLWTVGMGTVPSYVIGERQNGRKNVEILSVEVTRSQHDRNRRAEIVSNTVRKKDWDRVTDDNMALIHTPLDEEETLKAYNPKSGLYELSSTDRSTLSLLSGRKRFGQLKADDSERLERTARTLIYDVFGRAQYWDMPEHTMSQYNVYRYLSHLALAFGVQDKHKEIFSMDTKQLNLVRPIKIESATSSQDRTR